MAVAQVRPVIQETVAARFRKTAQQMSARKAVQAEVLVATWLVRA
jgi:hypothetical protein